ncbi:malto-oligosyltrehalose trehalohydrolase [Azorhizobium oxalatiphilum]|uniref:Malto-oligosyltrehalose trehalohydrolase n=2 Tax=Azorhizobium oxalatiphilum TaxID=980631 RepID=A0A917F2W4_9HYPH|nr:malto-oligosyltrehalose trehalohydrolase [Azorhizobium oxalatiphilum]
MPFGAAITRGGVHFRLWAPDVEKIDLHLIDGPVLPMSREEGGWHHLVSAEAKAGTRYAFRLPDGLEVPDPASRYQPSDVHGPSEVLDPSTYPWRDNDWRGRPWHEAVIYEMHVGTFTPEGTFAAAAQKLDALAELGITAVEIMPLADFPGRRNWGYDGTLLFAPEAAYGRPEDLKAFVEAAHARGIMVLLDVVYNHFGPDGNYLPVYVPRFFTERHHTPWGAAVNYDGADALPVRAFVIHNALYWIEEFHLDGLRLDAVQAIKDDSGEHLLDELARHLRTDNPDRPIHLILENEENDAARLEGDLPHTFTAQWNDDLHHVLHTAVTGEAEAYYGDYAGDMDKRLRAIAEGFAFQGEMMHHRGSERGTPSAHLPPTAFVSFTQNHDQIGNRAFGERLSALAPAPAVRAASALVLLAPQIPMLFMGEEWAASSPFLFFCDFTGDLADAVRRGRRAEFAKFSAFRDPARAAAIPDPLDVSTFRASTLDWSEIARAPHAEVRDWYRRILAVRREKVVPLIPAITAGGAGRIVRGQGIEVRWQAGGKELELMANLSADPVAGFAPSTGETLWTEGWFDGERAGPWSVRWTLR